MTEFCYRCTQCGFTLFSMTPKSAVFPYCIGGENGPPHVAQHMAHLPERDVDHSETWTPYPVAQGAT